MRTTILRNMPMRRAKKPAELLLVPMIDIFTVLVTFLLMTAVFSRITVLQLDLPSSAAGPPAEPKFRLEVVLRKEGLELTNGKTRIAAIPNVNGRYDLTTLSQLALSLKRDHPDVSNASVLVEPRIAYDEVIQVMDAIRGAEVLTNADGTIADQTVADPRAPQAGPRKRARVSLFTQIAIGDAP